MNADKFLRIKQVIERTGLSRPTIYGMMKNGTFPNKTAVGDRAVAWLESEIVRWMDARKSVEKTGKEAKPGKPPTASTKKKVPSSAVVNSPVDIPDASDHPVRQAGTAKQVSEPNDDWGQNDPPPTDAETDAIRFDRLAANRSQRSGGTPVKGRTKTFDILPTSAKNRKIVAVTSHDILGTRSADKKK